MIQNRTKAGTARSTSSRLTHATTWVLLALGVPVASLAAQEPESPARVVPERAERPIASLVEELGADDVEVRKAAEEALAARGKAAIESLQAAAEGHQDPEVQWRARRVLRRIRSGGDGAGLTPRDAEAPRDGGDRSARPVQPRGDASRMLEEMRAQMEEMRRRIEEMSGGLGRDLVDRISKSHQSSTSVQIGPDGVRVEVKETGEDGETVTRVYEAESMEALREKHPEIGDRTGFGIRELEGFPIPGVKIDFDVFGPEEIEVGPGGVEVRPFGGRILRPGQLRPRTGGGIDVIESVPPADGERLGIYVGDLAPEVRDFLEIEAGLGLLVSSVEDGSLGSDLGLRAKDVVLRIAGQDIRSTTDVRAALRGIAKGADVVVEVNRMGAVKRLKAAKRSDAPTAELRRG
ncbi:MAG: PDZ domain-containing protein, partial [Planctomycetota bacterium]|nr:PDZ domain-containing protein [Planctomycetota bacterium]